MRAASFPVPVTIMSAAPACLQITVCDNPCCPGPWIRTAELYPTPPWNSDHPTPLAIGVTSPASSGVTPLGTWCTTAFHGRYTYCAKPPHRCGGLFSQGEAERLGSGVGRQMGVFDGRDCPGWEHSRFPQPTEGSAKPR